MSEQPPEATSSDAAVADTIEAGDGFAEFLLKRAPGSHAELTEALRTVVAAVQETKKTGTVKYTLKIKPAKDLPGGAMIISDDVYSDVPQADRDAVGIMWPDKDGNLVDAPTNQLAIDLGAGAR